MNDEASQELTLEDRLKAIAYQFITLYERWSEDRQIAATQSADIASTVKKFTKQVNKLENIEEKIIGDVRESIFNETKNIAIYLGKTVGEAATKEAAPTVKKLSDSVDQSERILSDYRFSLSIHNATMIFIAVFSSVLASMLTARFLMPAPSLPLTQKQVAFLDSGQMMDLVWPKLTKKEQEHWIALADTIQHNKK